MRSPGTLRTNFHGPLPIGFLRNSSSPTFSMYFFGMIAPSGATARLSIAGRPICGPLVWILTVRSSATSISLMIRFSVAFGRGQRFRAHLAFEAELRRPPRSACRRCGISGPGRRWKVQVSPSSDSSHFSATPGPTPPFFVSNPTSEFVHRGLIDGVAGPAFEDRIQRLRRERVDREDQRSLLFRDLGLASAARAGCHREAASSAAPAQRLKVLRLGMTASRPVLVYCIKHRPAAGGTCPEHKQAVKAGIRVHSDSL